MSRQNVEAVRRAYEAAVRRDMTAVMNFAAPELRCYDRPARPDRRTYHGPEGLAQLLGEDLDVFDDFRYEPEAFFDSGDYVVAAIRQIGRGKASGMPVEERIANVWKLRGGKAVEMRVYSTLKEALEAIGLSEQDAHA